MSKRDHFFEGLFFGAVLGFVIGLFLAPPVLEGEAGKDNDEEDSLDTKIEKGEKTEAMISKTLEAIEHGFDKISSMVDKKEGSSKKN